MLFLLLRGGWCVFSRFSRAGVWLCLGLILLLGPAASLQAQSEGVTVRSIRVEGNKRVDSATIFYYIKTEVGKPLSREIIRNDIEQIYSLGQFTDIRVDTQQAPDGGAEVVYIVREIPSVGEVVFEGNDDLETSDLRDIVSIKRGITFKEHLVKDTIQKLTAHYHDKAYFLVQVDVETALNENGLMDVRILIKEGGKVKINEISFTGNESFSEGDLEDAMETGETWLFSWMDESGIYKKDALRLDVLRLEAFYKDHGYLKVRVHEPKIEVDREEQEINISIGIEEGLQYTLGEIKIQAVEEFTEEDLRKELQSRTGDTYNESLLRKDIIGITEMFSEKGYAYADINPRTRVDEEKRIVHIDMQIDPGRRVYVGKINILGNTRTRDNVVRREFRLKEGEIFNSKKLKRSKQRINNLGYFSNVKIDTHRGDSPEQIDIDAAVTEKPTGSITFGAGFSSVDKVIFNASVSQDNVFGTGRKAIISANISARRTNFNINLTDPRIFDSDLSAGFDLFNRRNDFFSYTSKSQGGGLRLGKYLSETDWFGLNYRYTETEIFNVLTPTALLKNETRTTSRIGASFIRDSRDNFMTPTQGWRHVVRLEFAGDVLGGANFYKTEYEITYYHKIVGNLVGAVHGEFKHAEGYGGEELPIFERYYLGGANSLRGFTLRQVGPLTANGDPLGGEQALLLNVELQHPITEGFRMFVFYDRGNVYGSGDRIGSTDSSFNFKKMRESWGAGIRFFSPFGPISLAYGFKLDQRPGESAGEFHFSAGNAF